MARSTYLSTNLTQPQIDLLLMLDDHELNIFSLEQVKKIAGRKFSNVSELVENLVHKKILSRIERGKFCKANFRDENVIGCFLVEDGAIAYWSALNKHGLTEQFPNTIFIQTTKLKPAKTVFGSRYQFIKIAKAKRAGIVTEGFGNSRYAMTDVEKTIVDCFDLPEYSGGYAELLRAFDQADLGSSKLIDYCKAIGNKSATKRMGLLAEMLKPEQLKSFITFAKKEVNQKYNLFDPAGQDEGEFVNAWRLRLNISRENILNIVTKQY
jgi:predicted transcriptional regulator of viral defense system